MGTREKTERKGGSRSRSRGAPAQRPKFTLETGAKLEAFQQLLSAMMPDWCQAGRCFTTLSLEMGAGSGRTCRKERSRRLTKLEQDRRGGLRGLGSLLSLVCLKPKSPLGRLGAGEVGGVRTEAGKTCSTTDQKQLLPKDVRAATTAPDTSQVLIKSLSNPSTKAPLSYFIGDKTVRVRSPAKASGW